jgi:hypothetical protein
LLGFFKEQYPLEFLEVLSNHQGTCTWKEATSDVVDDNAEAEDADEGDNAVADDSSKITTMTNGLKWLPAGCIESKTLIEEGSASYLYFNLQPKYGGNFDVGLYTDSSCIVPYTYPTGGDTSITVSSVLNTYYGYEIDTSNSISTMNSLLDDFKVCQPCRTYDVTNNVDDGNGNWFVCNDSAGYAGVNMCNMFATTTTIEKASFRDVSTASSQTTIVRTYSATDVTETWWQRWGFLLLSALVFVFGLLCFVSVAVKRKRSNTMLNNRKKLFGNNTDKQQPLIGAEN